MTPGDTPLRRFAVYDADGAFLRQGVARDPQAQAGPGETVFEDLARPETLQVRDGRLHPLPEALLAARVLAWKWRQIRARRAALFRAHVDSLNPIRWEAMSEPQKQAWRAYRQALQDIPQDFANPDDVTWPTRPE